MGKIRRALGLGGNIVLYQNTVKIIMGRTVRFTISLDEKLLTQFDRLCAGRCYATRSEALRDLIRSRLIEEDWDDRQHAIGTITLVYDHHVPSLLAKLVQIQHDHQLLVLSTMHVHIDHDNCLEVIAVKGQGREIRELANRLISVRGIKHGGLTATTTGVEFNRA